MARYTGLAVSFAALVGAYAEARALQSPGLSAKDSTAFKPAFFNSTACEGSKVLPEAATGSSDHQTSSKTASTRSQSRKCVAVVAPQFDGLNCYETMIFRR
jgi:kynureninase